MASGTSYRLAMLGTSGAPRLLTTAVTVVTATSVANSQRSSASLTRSFPQTSVIRTDACAR